MLIMYLNSICSDVSAILYQLMLGFMFFFNNENCTVTLSFSFIYMCIINLFY